MIAQHHHDMLTASGITPEHATARGYETITDKRRLAEVGIVKPGRRLPGLLIPQLRLDGSTWGWQYRPDTPRLRDGKPVKYETPWQQRNGLDIPPGVADRLGDPAIPLWITEGVKKADCGALNGLCIVALSGTWNWLCTNVVGGKVALPDWRDVALDGRRVIVAFDGDVARKPSVQKASHALAGYLAYKGAHIEYLWLPDEEEKIGLDDYLSQHTVEDLWRLVKPTPPLATTEKLKGLREHRRVEPLKPEAVQPVSLDVAHEVFGKWLGEDYDTDALHAMLAGAAVERLDGDPLWLLIVSGPGNAKTETVQSLSASGAIITSTISSEGALLSATPQRERAKEATGGLLRQLEPRGTLVIKDVTSILSMDRNIRDKVLAALREIYDGYWSRNVGVDGGRTLNWRGRIALIGAVTTAWDSHHAVVAALGDRFVLIRADSTKGRQTAGRRAIANTGQEEEMRKALSTVVAGVIAGMNPTPIELTDLHNEALLRAADVVTLARTGVVYDYRGDVIDSHAPEMPTRFAKQLAQVVRGGVAVGMSHPDALKLAIRCARDSMPPLRLAIIDDIAKHPHSPTTQVRKRVDKPYKTVDRQLQALHMLGLLTCAEEAYDANRNRWFYSLADGIDPNALDPESVPDLLLHAPNPDRSDEGIEIDTPRGDGHFSGTLSGPSINGQPAPGFKLPTGPGRCTACGFHIASQGHRSGCPEAAEAVPG